MENKANNPNTSSPKTSAVETFKKRFLKLAKTQFGNFKNDGGSDDDKEEKKSANNLDINLGINSDPDSENGSRKKPHVKKGGDKESKIELKTPMENYALNSKEEEYLSNYLKFNYYLENNKIKHINAGNQGSIPKEELTADDIPREATLVNRIKELDKQTIPKNTKYFFNSIEISSMDLNKKRKKVQLSLQNMSIKQNEVKILGNENIMKGDFNEMPETIDSVVLKKIKNMKLNNNNKIGQVIDNKGKIEEESKSTPTSSGNEECRII